jgi:hypothetical protein
MRALAGADQNWGTRIHETGRLGQSGAGPSLRADQTGYAGGWLPEGDVEPLLLLMTHKGDSVGHQSVGDSRVCSTVSMGDGALGGAPAAANPDG